MTEARLDSPIVEAKQLDETAEMSTTNPSVDADDTVSERDAATGSGNASQSAAPAQTTGDHPLAQDAVPKDSDTVKADAKANEAEGAITKGGDTQDAGGDATVHGAGHESRTVTSKSTDNTAESSKEAQQYNQRSNNIVYATLSANKNRSYAYNIKSKYNHMPETDDAEEIRRQVEYYFYPSNLRRDEFLFKLVGGTQNNPVDLSQLVTFKRMHRFQPYTAVVEAIRGSAMLEITGEPGEEKVKRKEPLPAEYGTKYDVDRLAAIDDAEQRFWIYAKGFGDEDKTTQTDIEAYFHQFGPVTSVILRRTQPFLKFKGSVFVEFASVEAQQQFLALTSKPKYKGIHEINFKAKQEYVDKKAADIAAGKIQPNTRSDWTHGPQRGNRRPRGQSYRGEGSRYRGRDRAHRERDGSADDGSNWKSRRDKFQKGKHFNKRDRRNGRGNGKGRDEDNGQRRKQEYDDNGIPIVRATTKEEEMADRAAERAAAAQGNNKRAREHDSGDERGAAKKSKAEPVDPNFPRADA